MIPTLSAADRLRALAAEQLERDGWTREQVLEHQRRPWRHLETIDGRSADTLTFPARAGGEATVIPLRLGAPFARLPAVRQFQIVHDADGLEVRIALEPAAPSGMCERVRDAVLSVLDDAGAVAPPVRVTEVAELEREPGAAAKLKLVVSR